MVHLRTRNSNLELWYLSSDPFNVLLPSPITLIEPSCIWKSPHPIPAPDASVWSIKGRSKSGYASVGGSVKYVRSLSKISWRLSLHLIFCLDPRLSFLSLSSWYKGLTVWLKLGLIFGNSQLNLKGWKPKNLKLWNVSWSLPDFWCKCFSVSWVYSVPFCRNKPSKIWDFSFEEITFLWFILIPCFLSHCSTSFMWLRCSSNVFEKIRSPKYGIAKLSL